MRPGRRLLVACLLITAGLPGGVARAESGYLRLAQAGVDRAQARFWDRRLGWYDARLGGAGRPPLATVWDAVPLFEAVTDLQRAAPSPARGLALDRFVRGAERYWNPALRPHGGYAPYPGVRRAGERVWFDDNGWLGVAFLHAYEAGERRALPDAARALDFIVAAGWDGRGGGGIWWNTGHPYKAGEALASAALLSAGLYQHTRRPLYLRWTRRLIAWGDDHLRGDDGLYDRSDRDATPMPYVQGPLVEAFARLCTASRQASWCGRAEELARASTARFSRLDMGPQFDVIYLRSLLALYARDHDARWYEEAAANARRALANAAVTCTRAAGTGASPCRPCPACCRPTPRP